MPKCMWEKEECDLRAEGGEFYCLTHLVESRAPVRKPLMSASRFLGFAWPPPTLGEK